MALLFHHSSLSHESGLSMASPDIERELPYLPPEILSKILPQVSNLQDYGEFVHLWTQYRHVSSVFKSEIEKAIIDQHLKKPAIYIDPFTVLSDLFNQALVKEGKMSEKERMKPELYHSSVVYLSCKFHQLSPSGKEITFRYQDWSIETDGWPEFEYLSGKVMLRQATMWMHPTRQHLPVQIEWINRNKRVTLSLTFDWKQLFSMFVARDYNSHSRYFVYRRFHFGRPCRWPSGDDGTVRMCTEH